MTRKSAESLDAERVKFALSLVHYYEREESRVDAYRRACRNTPKLTVAERVILANALNLSMEEQ